MSEQVDRYIGGNTEGVDEDSFIGGQCEYCGGDPGECCCHEEDDGLPTCRDCGADLDPNGFCDECDGDPWE